MGIQWAAQCSPASTCGISRQPVDPLERQFNELPKADIEHVVKDPERKSHDVFSPFLALNLIPKYSCSETGGHAVGSVVIGILQRVVIVRSGLYTVVSSLRRAGLDRTPCSTAYCRKRNQHAHPLQVFQVK